VVFESPSEAVAPLIRLETARSAAAEPGPWRECKQPRSWSQASPMVALAQSRWFHVVHSVCARCDAASSCLDRGRSLCKAHNPDL